MGLGVCAEMIGASKLATAFGAGIWTRARVLAQVTSQLITTCESPGAILPRAFEGSLTGVAANVCLQMRALDVALVAAVLGACERTRTVVTNGAICVCGKLGSPAWNIHAVVSVVAVAVMFVLVLVLVRQAFIATFVVQLIAKRIMPLVEVVAVAVKVW